MLVAALALSASAAPIPPDDLAANIAAGHLLCSNPDTASKTCTTIDAYAPVSGDAYANTGELMISEVPLITIATTAVVRIENGAVCGTILAADLLNRRVRLNGADLPPERNAAVLAKLAEKFAPMVGKKSCETVSLIDGELLKFGQIQGVDIRLPGKSVKWITPQDGYKVAPHQ